VTRPFSAKQFHLLQKHVSALMAHKTIQLSIFVFNEYFTLPYINAPSGWKMGHLNCLETFFIFGLRKFTPNFSANPF
jgi:hypothetical protein